MNSCVRRILARFISKWKREKYQYFDNSCRLSREGKVCGNWLINESEPTKTCTRKDGGKCSLCDIKINYNHRVWPSPYPKVLVIKLGMDKRDGEKIKRLTHRDALDILASRLQITIDEFLELERKPVLEKLNSYSYSGGRSYLWCPVSQKFI